ncbi:calcium-independent phospholipase A2-gamma [Ambystoma mexicanum]|uniref:calcium-independent phospholipase A2-gamma n=1 Tax=Ambystoma mexicanum TaxID=8296 RepID=UPI0037E734E2
MSINLILDTYLYLLSKARNLSRKQVGKPLNFLFPFNICSRVSHTQPLRCFHLSNRQCKWTRSRTFCVTQQGFLQHKVIFYRNNCKVSTSSKGISKVSSSMSRIKSTLDSVSKAVGGTHNELIARIARAKANSDKVGKTPKDIVQSNKDVAANPIVAVQEEPNQTRDTFETNGKHELIWPGGHSTPLESIKDSSDSKDALFHVSYFATNFGETYNFLATHINYYFGADITMAQEKKANVILAKTNDGNLNDAPACSTTDVQNGPDAVSPNALVGQEATDADHGIADPSTTTKKSISNFLSNSSDSVQAFVDSYLGGLVPKRRSEAKSALEPQSKEEENIEVVNKGDKDPAKESKASEDKARRLSLQREKIIARVSVDNRTRGLVQSLRRASDRRVCINRIEELSCHLLEFPETRGVAVKEKAIPCLLRLRQTNDEFLQAAVREALALIGYIDPVRGQGIRVLTIDGGGTRGVVALQTLRKLEELTGKPIHELFDYICGVSTGSILAFMVGLFHIPLAECEELYRKLGTDVFKQNVIVGTVKMGWSHAFYDSEIWEKILKERMGSDILIESSRNANCPKVSAVSTIVNRGTPLKAFVFRNYNHLPGVKSHYMGGCQYNLWQAIRASSAAPGYFQEYALGNDLHQDGGLLINNPCALALHECKCLWPDVPLQCVISLGTGRYESTGKNNVTYTSLRAKLTNVISSATDTEEVHTMLDALLPPNTYFRFNPLMNEDVPLDENRKEKLNQLQVDGLRYLDRNEEKLKKAAKILVQEKTGFQRINDWMKLKADMYEGFPFFSKL